MGYFTIFRSFIYALITVALSFGVAVAKDVELSVNVVERRPTNTINDLLPASRGIFSPQIAYASENSKGVTLKPATISADVSQGAISQETITVSNNTGKDATFEISQSDYAVDTSNGTDSVFYQFGSQNDSLYPFLSIDPKRFEIKNGEDKKITLRIAPAPNQVSGKYKGAIFVAPVESEAKLNQSAINISGKVGTLVGVEVSGKSKTTNPVETVWDNSTSWLKTGLISGILLLIVFVIVRRRNRKSKLR